MAQLGSAAVSTGTLLLALWGLGRIIYQIELAPLAQALGRVRGPGLWLGYLLLLPGTVLHECSHAAACVGTGTRIHRFVPFHPQPDGTLGWVEHDHVGPIRSAIIGLAPLAGGVAALSELARLLLPGASVGTGSWADPALALWALPDQAWRLIQSVDPTQPAAWLFTYLALSIGRATAPSLPDLRQVAGLWAVCAGGLFLATLFIQVIGLGEWTLAANAIQQAILLITHLNGALVFVVAIILAAGGALLPAAIAAHLTIRKSMPMPVRSSRRSKRRA